MSPKNGGTFGDNTVLNYLTDIGRCYEMVNLKQGKKMSGAQTRSAVEISNSDRCDISTEQKITNAINSLNKAKRKRQEVAENERRNGTNGDTGDANNSNNGMVRSVRTQNNEDVNVNVRDVVEIDEPNRR